MQLAMHITHNHNPLIFPAGDVDLHAIGLAVDDLRRGEDDPVEDENGEDGREVGGRNAPGSPVKDEGKVVDPLQGQGAIVRPAYGGLDFRFVGPAGCGYRRGRLLPRVRRPIFHAHLSYDFPSFSFLGYLLEIQIYCFKF